MAASVRGTSHERTGQRIQDAHRCFSAGEFIVAVACDGAGSASNGGEGASLAARRISSLALDHVRSKSALPDDAMIEGWVDETRDLIARAANLRALQLRDFACTLVLAIATSKAIASAHIGDGAVVMLEDGHMSWSPLSWPEQGEYASTTYFLTDDGTPRLRISSVRRAPKSFAIMTDGIERLALDFASRSPHGPFLDVMTSPLVGRGPGRSDELSKALRSYLSNESVNARTDDDKTLIVATRQ